MICFNGDRVCSKIKCNEHTNVTQIFNIVDYLTGFTTSRNKAEAPKGSAYVCGSNTQKTVQMYYVIL